MQINLPIYYLITPDYEEGEDLIFFSALEASLKNGIRLVQLRSKNLSEGKYQRLAENTLEITKRYGAKLLLNGYADLAEKIGADGVHLPSANYMFEEGRPVSDKLLLSAACHDKTQLQQAKKIKTDLALVCPIFSTPSSPKGKPIGWSEFAEMTKLVDFPLYALGGLTIDDYKQAKQLGAHGIAAIRAFWNLQQPLH